MQLEECFVVLNNGNKNLANVDAKLKYFTRVSIQNSKSFYAFERDCETKEEFFKLVKEVADAIYDDGNFFINLLTKECDWDFNDGKATIHWANPTIGKMMTVHFMIKLELGYNHI